MPVEWFGEIAAVVTVSVVPTLKLGVTPTLEEGKSLQNKELRCHRVTPKVSRPWRNTPGGATLSFLSFQVNHGDRLAPSLATTQSEARLTGPSAGAGAHGNPVSCPREPGPIIQKGHHSAFSPLRKARAAAKKIISPLGAEKKNLREVDYEGPSKRETNLREVQAGQSSWPAVRHLRKSPPQTAPGVG